MAELLPCLPVGHEPSSITHPCSTLAAGETLGRAAPVLSTGAMGKLCPELFLPAFAPRFVVCQALRNQRVTSADPLLLGVWKHNAGYLPGCAPSLETPGQGSGPSSVQFGDAQPWHVVLCPFSDLCQLLLRVLMLLLERDTGPSVTQDLPGHTATAELHSWVPGE